MDLMEAQSSTLMCASKIVERSGLYGRTHWLSISISLFPCLMLTVWPPCPGARLLYSGYRSCPVCIFARSCLGNFLVHLPSFMRVALGLKQLQGPWTMHLLMIAYSAGSLDIGNLGRDERVDLVMGNPVFEPDQEMKVGQAALLPLDAV